MDLTRLPSSDPLDVYRYRDGLYAVDLLAAALLEFDFFTWLAAHPGDAAAICRGLGLHERPADVMLTLFCARGFIRRHDGQFAVTDVAREFLVRGGPFYVGPYYATLHDRPVARDYVQVLRTGRPANWSSSRDTKPWPQAMLTEEFAASFTAAMDARGTYLGSVLAAQLDLAGHRRLLDVAGGSGIYACAFAARHPHLAATVLERPPVDEVARTLIASRGFSQRVGVAAGDMFHSALPADHDVHLFSNVLHDWDVGPVRQLLAASFEALPPGGLLLIHDMHLDADKQGPVPVAEYSALLMNVTDGRCYSVGELGTWLRACGFEVLDHQPTAADRSVLSARKPR
jgi:SAM-dependent methyltransferase